MPKYKTTEFGEAVYPHLTHPDTAFSSDGIYQVKLRLPKDKATADIKAIEDTISLQVADAHKKNPKNTKMVKRAPKPYKEDGNDVILHFKCKAKGINGETGKPFEQKPVLLDSDLNRLSEDKLIYGGSVMSIKYEPVGYNVASTGIGCTLRLKGAQIVKLVEGETDTSGFSKVDPKEYESRLPK